MKNTSIETLLEILVTGLADADQVAFEEYCRAEYGAARAQAGAEEATKGIKVSGKGDKARATLKGADAKLTGHNTALRCLAFASAVKEVADSIGMECPTVDVTPYAQVWLARRTKNVANEATPA